MALEKRITNLVQNGGANQINVQLPVRWVETDKGRKIVAIAHILNRDDIVNIKKAVRKNKDTAISQVEELIRPLSQKMISNFKDLGCLNRLLLIAIYQDKGIKIDFTPYRDYWTARSEYTIGNTTHVTTVWGSTIEPHVHNEIYIQFMANVFSALVTAAMIGAYHLMFHL